MPTKIGEVGQALGATANRRRSSRQWIEKAAIMRAQADRFGVRLPHRKGGACDRASASRTDKPAARPPSRKTGSATPAFNIEDFELYVTSRARSTAAFIVILVFGRTTNAEARHRALMKAARGLPGSGRSTASYGP